MKRSILAILMTCTLASTGVLMAQSTINTTAPGPTTQQEPGQTNNNLPNPGNPQTQLDRGTTSSAPTDTYGTTGQSTTTTGTQTGQSTATGTTGTMNDQGTTGTMGSATGTTTTTTTDTDVDVENDMNSTSRSTGAMTTDTTSSDQSTSGGSYSGSDTDTLPSTGSDQPLLALLGLLAIGAALAIRQVR